MIVYHVCGLNKFKRYLEAGEIKAPVRAWDNINSAEEFSKQTGRPIILRLRFSFAKRLEGHKQNAVYIAEDFSLEKSLGVRRN